MNWLYCGSCEDYPGQLENTSEDVHTFRSALDHLMHMWQIADYYDVSSLKKGCEESVSAWLGSSLMDPITVFKWIPMVYACTSDDGNRGPRDAILSFVLENQDIMRQGEARNAAFPELRDECGEFDRELVEILLQESSINEKTSRRQRGSELLIFATGGSSNNNHSRASPTSSRGRSSSVRSSSGSRRSAFLREYPIFNRKSERQPWVCQKHIFIEVRSWQ